MSPYHTKERYLPAPEFWSTLVESNALSPSLANQFRECLEKGLWMPLGAILVSQGFIKLKEVTGLLAIQEQEPNTRIGDLAVREGYCTARQIEAALEIQRRACPGHIDLVLRESTSSDATLQALVAYIHFLESKVAEFGIQK